MSQEYGIVCCIYANRDRLMVCASVCMCVCCVNSNLIYQSTLGRFSGVAPTKSAGKQTPVNRRQELTLIE